MKQRLDVMIEVPEGYEIIGLRAPKKGEFVLLKDEVRPSPGWWESEYVILRKVEPRRRVFECVSETPRAVDIGEFYETHFGISGPCTGNPYGKLKVFKEITDEVTVTRNDHF